MKHLLLLVILLASLVFGALPVVAVQAYAPVVPWQQDSAEEASERIEALRVETPTVHSTYNRDDGSMDLESDDEVSRYFRGGSYHIRIDANELVGWSELESRAGDFYLEVASFQVDGTLDNEFGVLFRYADEDNFYFFAITSDGYYRLDKQVDGEWVTVVDWQESDAINTGEGSDNLIGLLVEGAAYTLLVNDTVLETVEEEVTDGRGFALAVGTFDEGGVEIAFDDLKLWQLDEGDELVTPEPTETPAPDATPDPALLEALIEPVRAGDPDYSADFRRDTGDWPTVDEGTTVIAIQDRALNFNVEGVFSAAWSTGEELSALNPADFYLEVDVTREAGPANAEYGILSRFQDDDNYYYYALNGDGEYSLWRVAETLLTPLIDWTASDAILAEDGAVNRLGLWAQGERLLLLANDTVLAEVEDDTFAAGGVGFYVLTSDVGGLEVDFDNLDLWLLAPPEDVPADDGPPADDETLAALLAEAESLQTMEPESSDTFARDQGNWGMESSDDASYDYVRGRLQIDVTAREWLAWSEAEQEFSDFALEVETTQMSGDAPAGEVGIVFRKVDDENFYFFAVDSSGSYSLWKKVAGEWQAIVEWTASEAIEVGAGAENRLTILAEGSRLGLLVNDTALAVVEDDSFAAGTLALAAGTFAEPGYVAAFDNLSIWLLPAVQG